MDQNVFGSRALPGPRKEGGSLRPTLRNPAYGIVYNNTRNHHVSLSTSTTESTTMSHSVPAQQNQLP